MSAKHQVRIRNSFSDRNHLLSIPKEMQYTEFEDGTRIVLYNCLKNLFKYPRDNEQFNEQIFVKIVVENIFNEPYEEYSISYDGIWNELLENFRDDSYHEVLSIIEYLCNVYENTKKAYSGPYGETFGEPNKKDSYKVLNDIFEIEYIGYRFVNKQIVSITNKEEIEEINDAITDSSESVKTSLAKAVSFMSEKEKDYKNSIKESITALEQFMNIKLNTSGLVLSNSIDQFASKFDFDENLKQSIKYLYKFASNANGIRHGNNKKNGNVGFKEAKLVLLICCSTINYLKN